MKKFFSLQILTIAFLTIFISCKREDPEPEPDTGKVVFKFGHFCDGSPIGMDTMHYVNAAGNPYEVNEIQWFISDVWLHRSGEDDLLLDAWKDIHYVDTDIESSRSWEVLDDIPAGNYDSITFTFGISGPKNIPYMYVNPPESYMFWPIFLGGQNGGYHYMKLNGKFRKNDGSTITPFDFHIGVGQIYASGVVDVDSITGFVQNSFSVGLPASSFSMAKDQNVEIQIIMNVEKWFNNPVYDHDVWGGYIMQNQAAMELVKQNGDDVFTIGYIQ